MFKHLAVLERQVKWARLIKNSSYSYHMSDLMEPRTEKKIVIYPQMVPLYVDYLLNNKFNQRQMISIFLSSIKTNLPQQQMFHKMVDSLLVHIDEIERFNTISTVLTRLYLTKYEDKEKAYILAKKGFQLLKKDSKQKSFFAIRFLISIEELVGLHRFQNADYSLFSIEKFKPLFIVFLLELFWKNDLQKTYAIADQAMNLFLKHENLIPYNDLHHLYYSKKIIKDKKFIELVYRLKDRIKTNMQNDGIKKIQEEKDKEEDYLVEKMLDNYFQQKIQKYM